MPQCSRTHPWYPGIDIGHTHQYGSQVNIRNIRLDWDTRAYIKVDEYSMFNNKLEIAMQSFLKTLILPLLLVAPGLAICPGFNFGIGNLLPLGGGFNRCRWSSSIFKVASSISSLFVVGTVYDTSCNAIDSLTTNKNPCDQGIFGCSPPPVLFNEYTSTISGLR